ncbi:hypothetical protein EV424DRAFT_1534485 [Suillus variegatus]|nr:hypothetical protein EV424DRAFT_1534485 [Suillus variegatus]
MSGDALCELLHFDLKGFSHQFAHPTQSSTLYPQGSPKHSKGTLVIYLCLNDGDPTYPVTIIEGAKVDVDDDKTTLRVVLATILPFLNHSSQFAYHNHNIMIEIFHTNIQLTRKPTEQSANTTEFKLYEE